MKIKNWKEFDNKLYEYSNRDYRDDMEVLSEEIAKRGDTCFYVMQGDGKYVDVSKYAITENMRNGFQEFSDVSMGNIKDVAEFIYAFAEEMGGTPLLEHEAKSLLESLQHTVDGEADTEYLEDFPEFENAITDSEKEFRKTEKEELAARKKQIDEEDRQWREE